MILFYFTSFLLIKTEIVNHNCSFSNIDLGEYNDEWIDLHINCEPQKIQKINLKDLNHVNSISIFDNSNVILSCSQSNFTSEYLFLSIYDRPTITIENHCHLNQIEIYGSPIFQLFDESNFSVDSLISYNKTYEFPFESKSITYLENMENVNVSYGKNQSIPENNFLCENDIFNFSLESNYITAKCGNRYENLFLYESIPEITFTINNTNVFFKNQCQSNETAKKNIETVLSSLNFVNKREVTFDVFDPDSISSYTSSDSEGTWVLIKYDRVCQWRGSFNSNYYFDGDLEDREEVQYYLQRGWKKICRGSDSYVYCCDTDLGPRNINVISAAGSLAIIIISICLVVILFVSLCVIARCRYNNNRRVGNG